MAVFPVFKKVLGLCIEVAKDRVNFRGWPLVHKGIEIINEDVDREFCFDGVSYPNIDQAIEHYSLNFSLDSDFLRRVLAKIGLQQFAKAVRFCRLYVGATPNEKSQALREIS